MTSTSVVSSSEQVARILSKEWFDGEELMNIAFTLMEGETYISVNRPLISTYSADVASFIAKHPAYSFKADTYKRATLNVAHIRGIEIDAFGKKLNINVEVEPRDVRTKSHAGIFTRYENRNLKVGDSLRILEKNVSADDVLIKVRSQLLSLSVIEQRSI